jgi:hypothetical protein
MGKKNWHWHIPLPIKTNNTAEEQQPMAKSHFLGREWIMIAASTAQKNRHCHKHTFSSSFLLSSILSSRNQ